MKMRIKAVELRFTTTDLNVFQDMQAVEQVGEIVVGTAQVAPAGLPQGINDAVGAILWLSVFGPSGAQSSLTPWR
jgi:hypothetical protein